MDSRGIFFRGGVLDRNRLASVDCRGNSRVHADQGNQSESAGGGTVQRPEARGLLIGLHATSPESLTTFTCASVPGTVPESFTRVGANYRASARCHERPSANRSLHESVCFDRLATGNRDGGVESKSIGIGRESDQHYRLAEPERFHFDLGCGHCGGDSAVIEDGAMKEVQPSITFNLARGLSSLADQAAAKLIQKAPALSTPLQACADIVKQAIHENPEIPKHDITAVDLARRAGILQTRRRRA